MMDENVKAGMVMETVDENGNKITYENNEDGGFSATVDCSENPIPTSVPITSVCLLRTKDGLKPDKENGKEISTIFEILEVGDQINHQTVTEVNRDSITLDYFGRQSVLDNESEVFSVLIKEEIEEWKRLLAEKDLLTLFELEEEESVHLFRVLELLCMNTNMEEVNAIYTNDQSPFAQRMLAMISGTLRKPIVETQKDLNGKKVIAYYIDYSDVNDSIKKYIESINGTLLYNVAITNKEGLNVAEGDRVILC